MTNTWFFYLGVILLIVLFEIVNYKLTRIFNFGFEVRLSIEELDTELEIPLLACVVVSEWEVSDASVAALVPMGVYRDFE